MKQHQYVNIIDYPSVHTTILGFLLGDMVGSTYEWPAEKRTKNKNFPLYPVGSTFTDDTVLTIATIKALLDAKESGTELSDIDYGPYYKDFARRYPGRAYGSRFESWIAGASMGDSFGNGAAMRVSPVAYVATSESLAAIGAAAVARPTHNHIDAREAAILTAQAVFLAGRARKEGNLPKDIYFALGFAQNKRAYAKEKRFTSPEPSAYKHLYKGKISESFPSVPQAIACFVSTRSFERAVRLAVAQGMDADTQASIAGAIALRYYQELPRAFVELAPPVPYEFIELLEKFSKAYDVPPITLTNNKKQWQKKQKEV